MIWSGSGLSWRRTPMTIKRAWFPRVTGRKCCAGFVARTRQDARQTVPPPPWRSVTTPMVPENPARRIRRRRPMARKRKDRDAAGPAAAAAVVMVLYITDSGPNSVRAVANLEAICKEHLKDNFRLE